MSKKKAKKKEQEDLILLVGDVLDEKYKTLTEEIFLMQEEVKREQKKAKKRAYKRMKKSNDFYIPKLSLKEETIAKLEGSWLDQLINFLNQLKPVIRAIASAIMQLVISILSIDAIKYRCSPTTLSKLGDVFNLARKTSIALAA